ncbi:hypothetical protein CDD83_5208 [Cordyceps sp. RAO-2017]|nr:hypothetical protein CDD83_5208 [Cordyceps sp. RAO-2017]
MAVAPPRAKDRLDTLQLLVNDVLVQTGKALRASRRDGHGNVPAAHCSLQARLPETIKAFHAALDDLESDIIRAKSVLLRDLNELQSQNAQAKSSEQLQPPLTGSKSKSPATIDLDSSPTALPRDHPAKTDPVTKLVAPFPDMGMSIPDTALAPAAMKEENAPTQPPSILGGGPEANMDGGTALSTADHKSVGEQHIGPGGDDTLNMNPGLNFTDMEFTLASTNNDSQGQLNGDTGNLVTAESSFDLASFAPADCTNHANGNNVNSLESILPTNLGLPTGAQDAGDNHAKPGDNRNEMPDSAFADIFTGDGQADGMDFDFSIGNDAMGGDTFDDMMNDRDNTFNTIEHGDFEATFFGLEKTDGT